MDKCGTCLFFDRGGAGGSAGGTSWGQCRRASPMLHPVNVKAYMIEGVWPHVRDDDWCGQWSSGARAARADAARVEAAHAMQALRAADTAPAAPPSRAPSAIPAARPGMLAPLPGGAAGVPGAPPPAVVVHAGD